MRNKILVCLFLLIVTAAVYSPVAHYPFLGLDDVLYVNNPHERAGLTWKTFKWALTSTDQGYPEPLSLLSHALDFQLFRMNAGRHHITNIVLHLVNVVILFLLLMRVTGKAWRSLFVAALFALHPVNVESVAWVAERKNLLCILFFFLTLGAYGWYARQPNVRRYLLVSFLFLLALASKPMAITLPFVLLLLDFWPLKRVEGWGDPVQGKPVQKGKKHKIQIAPPVFPVPRVRFTRLVLEKLPLLPLCGASAAASVVGQSRIIKQTQISFGLRLGEAVYSYAVYLRNAVWPADLWVGPSWLFDYSSDVEGACKIGLAATLLVTISAVVWEQRRSRPYLLLGWLWYLGTLVPMSGVVWMGDYSRGDRYGYISLIGIFVAAVWSIADWCRRLDRRLLVMAAIAIVAASALRTRTQLRYWSSDFALWHHGAELDPSVSEILPTEPVDMDPAAAKLKVKVDSVLNRTPFDLRMRTEAAAALQKKGDSSSAIDEYRIIAGMEPPLKAANVYAEIGEIFRGEGANSSARENYAKARQIYQLTLRADSYATKQAMVKFARFVARDPDHSPKNAFGISPYLAMGIFWREAGNPAIAAANFNHVKQLDPTFDLGLLGTE
jgi:hypothetical protein